MYLAWVWDEGAQGERLTHVEENQRINGGNKFINIHMFLKKEQNLKKKACMDVNLNPLLKMSPEMSKISFYFGFSVFTSF